MFTTENPSVCAGNMHFPSVSTVRSSIAVRPVPFLKLSLPLPLSLNSARITLFITDIFSENSSAPECLSVFVSVSTRFSFMQFHMRNVTLSKSPLISSVVLMLYFALYSPSISLSSLIPIVLLSGRSSRSACLISSTPLVQKLAEQKMLIVWLTVRYPITRLPYSLILKRQNLRITSLSPARFATRVAYSWAEMSLQETDLSV